MRGPCTSTPGNRIVSTCPSRATFVACAEGTDQTVIEIDANRVGLRASGQVMRFAGYLAIYAETQDEASQDDEDLGSLPDIHGGGGGA